MRHRAALRILALVIAVGGASLVSSPVGARVENAGVQIQLLDSGTAPRSVLRLKPDASPIRRTLTFSSQVTQSGVSSQSVGPLDVQTVVSIAPRLAGASGTIRVPYTYGAFQLLDSSVGTPQQLAAVRTSLAQFQGFRGEYTLSSTGAVLANRLSIPSTVNSTLRSLLQQFSDQSSQLSVPLPTQAVGIGARWRGSTQLVASGIRSRQTYDYTLRSHDGTRLSIDAAYVQTAPRQRVTSKSLSSGATVDVTSYHVAGTGTTVFDLSQIAPVSGHLTADGVQVFRVQQGGQSGTINQQLHLGIVIAAG